MTDFVFTNNITDNIILSVLTNAKEDNLLNDMHSEMIKRIYEYRKLGPVIAVTKGDVTLGIGGVGKIHTGLGQAWLIPNRLFLKYPKTLFKTSKKFIEDAYIKMELHRIQIDVDASFPENVRFAEKLGFYNEGIMKRYGPKMQDFYRFVYIRE